MEAIGAAKFLSPDVTLKALRQVKQGKIYRLAQVLNTDIPQLADSPDDHPQPQVRGRARARRAARARARSARSSSFRRTRERTSTHSATGIKTIVSSAAEAQTKCGAKTD